MFFKFVLKGFKLKKLVVEPKTAQPIEPNKESIDRQLNWSRFRLTPSSTGRGPGRPPTQPVEGAKKISLSSRMIVQPVKVEP